MTTVAEFSIQELLETFQFISGCSDEQYKRTPLLAHWKDLGDCAEVSRYCDLYLKLENMQVTGACSISFTHVDSIYIVSYHLNSLLKLLCKSCSPSVL